MPFVSKIFTFSTVFGIYLLYVTLLSSDNNQCIIPKRGIEIIETIDYYDEKKSNMLNDFISFVKRKLKS